MRSGRLGLTPFGILPDLDNIGKSSREFMQFRKRVSGAKKEVDSQVLEIFRCCATKYWLGFA